MLLWQECLAQPPLSPEFFPELVFHIWCLWLYPINYLHLTLQNGGPAIPIEDFPIEDFPIEDFPIEDFSIENFPIEDFPIENFPIEDFYHPCSQQSYHNYWCQLDFRVCKLNQFSESLIWFFDIKIFQRLHNMSLHKVRMYPFEFLCWFCWKDPTFCTMI